jgi:cytochrome c-type biogenesis protein CcmH
MNFWIIAIALLAVPAAIVCWPLFKGPAKEKITGLFVVLVLPLAGILMYQEIGTPEAIHLPRASVAGQAAQQQSAHAMQGGQMDALIESLQQRMKENPSDPEGWLILGRSLKTMQRYAEAETALSNANRMIPGNPTIMVELAEAKLFNSGQAAISDEARQLLQSALAIDPNQQKGLWIMGLASAQAGDDGQAVTYWTKLLNQLEPGSGPYQSISEQIAMAQTRMGQPVSVGAMAGQSAASETAAAAPPMAKPAENTPAADGFSIPVTVNLGSDVSGPFPASAALFVFVHPAGAVGMPLAVKRMAPQGFPMALQFTDADLLRPGQSLQDFDQLDISARISMAGVAGSASGDIQADRITVATNNVSAIALNLDQRVP